MPSLLADLSLLALGLGLLLLGGEWLVRGASGLARTLGLSPLAVGLTVVAMGTSAPELAVNLAAALHGNGDLSFGNVVGSNIANVGLVVGAAALLRPIPVNGSLARREIPMMLLVTGIAWALGADAWLADGPDRYARSDGLVLLVLFGTFAWITFGRGREEAAIAGGAGDEAEAPPRTPRPRGVDPALVLVGVGVLIFGAEVAVRGATDLARDFGVPEVVIGLSLVAIGTSLPELATSVVAAWRGAMDIAVGNVVGSNVFNLLLVLGASASVRSIPLPEGGHTDLAVASALSVALWLAVTLRSRSIRRLEGVLFCGAYVAYLSLRGAGALH